MNICIFGDSVAKGVVYDDEKKKYVFLKDSFVNLFQRESNITVKNFAKFGCTVSKGEKILESHNTELSNYDYTLLEFGGNDCDFNWPDVAAAPDKMHLPNVPLSQFTNYYKDIITKIKESGSTPVMLSLPPLNPNSFFDWVSKGLNKDNILKYIHDIHFIYRWHESYNLQLFELADEYDIPIIDIRKEFLQQKNYEDYLCIDGMHPNAKGHQLILKSLSDFIKNKNLQLA